MTPHADINTSLGGGFTNSPKLQSFENMRRASIGVHCFELPMAIMLPVFVSAHIVPGSARERLRASSRGRLLLSRVPEQVAARTPASCHEWLCKLPRGRRQVCASACACVLRAFAGTQIVPGSTREWLCRSSRGSLQVVTSGCASRHEGRCTRWKNSASRQKAYASHPEDGC